MINVRLGKMSPTSSRCDQYITLFPGFFWSKPVGCVKSERFITHADGSYKRGCFCRPWTLDQVLTARTDVGTEEHWLPIQQILEAATTRPLWSLLTGSTTRPRRKPRKGACLVANDTGHVTLFTEQRERSPHHQSGVTLWEKRAKNEFGNRV